MTTTEMLLNIFRGYDKKVSIVFDSDGGLIIESDGIVYNGCFLSTEEALIRAYIEFKAKRRNNSEVNK